MDTNTVDLPAGYYSAEELYQTTHADIGLIIADAELGLITAEEALKEIIKARQNAKDYTTALFDAGLI